MKTTLIALSAIALVATGAASGATKATHTTGVAHVSVTHAERNNTRLFVAGDVNDKLFGRGAIVFVSSGTPRPSQGGDIVIDVVARRITVYTTKGTLTGTGSGVQTIKQDGNSDIVGKFNLTRGTHTMKGHTMKGTFAGTGPGDGPYRLVYKATFR